MAFYLRIVFIFSCSNLSIYLPVFANGAFDSTTKKSTKQKITSTTPRVPIDLQDLGYYDGDWEKFCDRKSIKEEFSYYREHELKKLRILLCEIWAQKKFDAQSRAVSAVYKYCVVMRNRVDRFIEDFVEKFSMDDASKKEHLVSKGDFNEDSACYNASVKEFEKKCVAPENPYTFMFRQIFGRACTYAELTTEVILTTIDEVCRDRFMTDEIDFKPYLLSIGYREP